MSVDTLYEIIGGRSKIHAAVDLFYQKVQADPSMKPFFDGQDMSRLRAGQSMFLSMLLGGKTVYTGKETGIEPTSSSECPNLTFKVIHDIIYSIKIVLGA